MKRRVMPYRLRRERANRLHGAGELRPGVDGADACFASASGRARAADDEREALRRRSRR